MKSIKLMRPGELTVGDSTENLLVTDDNVKVEVKACGVCGSDLSLYRGTRDISKETYFGHEFSGVVVDAGKGANGIQAGMRVASELVHGCGRCWNCRNGLANYCKGLNEVLYPGGFTENTLVTNADSFSFLSPIPDDLDDITAALMEPANCAFRIADKAAVRPGSTAVVFGVGAMGVFSALIMKTLGAGKVVMLNRAGQRLDNLRAAGILDTVCTSDPDWQDQVKEMVGPDGPDIAVEATGVANIFRDALGIVRRGGRVVVGSVYSGAIENFEPLPIFRKELTVVGAKGPSPMVKSDGTSAVVDKVVQLREELNKVITVYDYKDVKEAFEDAKSGKAIKAVVKF